MSLNFKSDNNKFKKGLYLISTPIGNLEDITFRAIEILKNSDHILCEDTRVSKNLLKKYNINSNLISYHKFNEAKSLDKTISLLKSGSLISLISDAGTPVVSDPGKLLVNECIKNDIRIVPIPGPSAVTSAISISGFSEKFYFYGFLPEKKKILKNDLLKLSGLDCSIVFFVSAKKLEKTLIEFKNYFLERNILICREMTKIYEEFFRSTVREIDISKLTLKGEVTVVISEKIDEKNSSQTLSESDKNKINKMIKKLSIREITSLICLDKKISKKDVYNYCLKIKNEN
jgi:16S rRNA (cytidine1402-2'-O)-methyltransferase